MAKIVRSKAHPRFGATPKQAKHNQEFRDLSNKVFLLEQELVTTKIERDGFRNEAATITRNAKALLEQVSDNHPDRVTKAQLDQVIHDRAMLRVEVSDLRGQITGLTQALTILATGKVLT